MKRLLILGVGAQGSTVAKRMNEESGVSENICNGTSHSYLDDKVDVEMIKDHLKNAQHIPRLNYLMNTAYKNEINHLLKNNLRAYRQVTDIAESRELILNNQSKID